MDINTTVTRNTSKLNALLSVYSDCPELVAEFKAMSYFEIAEEYKNEFNTNLTPGEIRYFHKRPHLGVSLKGVLVIPGWLDS